MTTGQQAPAARVDYLDWLRVLAVAGVFVYHAAHPFDTTAWSVKNAEQSKTLLVALGFIGSWGMAFFFVVAGAASYLALRWRSSLRFVRERLVRLLLPLIAAYILLSPLQYVIEQRQLDTPESVLGNIGRFFDGAWQGPPIMVANPYHLWFVVFLLEFSLLGLPLFAWLRGRRGRHVVEWLGDHTEHRGTVLLVILPIALVYIASKRAPGDHGWGEFGYYFGFFLLGHVLMADPRLMRAIRRSLVPALLLAVACAVLLLASGAVDFVAAWWTDRAYSWMYGWIFLLGIVHAWAWITAALNLGLRVPAFQRPLPDTVASAAMPFFLIHQPVVLAIASVVVEWNAGIPAKLFVVLVSSFLVSAVLAVALARLPGVSMLFGVKRRPESVAEEEIPAFDGVAPTADETP